MRNLITVLLLSFAALLVSWSPLSWLPLSALAPASVSGIVFFDVDGDGIPDSTETTAANAVVNIQEVGSDFISSMITDEFGYFNTGDIEHGIYNVWTEINNVSSVVTIVEINDAHGAAVVNLPIGAAYKVMLPFVSN